ncbi:MAG: hypothetical protein H7062_25740 [Candidatus Saccharimonas sp.]|nr:hypothetical protein [Planctomycetaceae bacterium]
MKFSEVILTVPYRVLEFLFRDSALGIGLSGCLIVAIIATAFMIERWYSEKPTPHTGWWFFAAIVLLPCVFVVSAPRFGLFNSQEVVFVFLAAVQAYFCLATLVACETYWRRLDPINYVTAAIAAVVATAIWFFSGSLYLALMS